MMNNFLLPGLQDLCVSRTTFSWGIPVDFDPKHVTYVWLDALTNYITGIGYDCDGNHTDQFKKYWPADLHLIGKDIIRFHTIYWPIFLMALDLPLPKQVFGHPWLLQGDGKMSKSKGNVLYADTLVDFFGVDAVRYFVLHEMPFENDGVISWELMVERMNSDLANILGNLVNRTISMTNKYFGGVVADKSVTAPEDEDLKAVVLEAVKKADAKMDQLRVADAITEIFNIFRRSNKYIDETAPWVLAKDEEKKDRLSTVLYNLTEAITIGASLLESFMPETSAKILAQLNTAKRSLDELQSVTAPEDEDLKAVVLEAVKKADAKMDQLRVADAITEIFNIFRRSNKYIDETAPWVLAKDEEKKDRLSTVLYNLTEAITIGASLLESFMPETSAKILAQLNTAKRSLDELQTFGLYPSGNQVTDKPEILFARMDVKEVLEKAEALQAAQAAEAAKESGADAENAEEEDGIDLEPKAEITYDDFAKLQFQVGEIIKCEAVPKSKKLLCSQVKIGTKTRQIISGIKAHYTPEEMVGKKVMVVTNLKPAKLAGMLSEGMILCAEDAEGNLALMTPEKKMPAGAEIC